VDARHKARHDDPLLFHFNGFVMVGLVPAIHAVAGIPLVACHGAFFRILLAAFHWSRRCLPKKTAEAQVTTAPRQGCGHHPPDISGCAELLRDNHCAKIGEGEDRI
jgi:hypothetical protein